MKKKFTLQLFLESLARRGIYDSFNPSKDLKVVDLSALGANSKVWRLDSR